MAECAAGIIKANGFAERIKLVSKRSTNMTVGAGCDMERRANILVTEVFDTELIGEGALSTFHHAHKCLLEVGFFVSSVLILVHIFLTNYFCHCRRIAWWCQQVEKFGYKW